MNNLLQLIDTQGLGLITWDKIKKCMGIDPKSKTGRDIIDKWVDEANKQLRIKLVQRESGIQCVDNYVERYVVGCPSVAQAVDGNVYEDHKQATEAASKAGNGATVLSVRWVRERKNGLTLVRVMPPKGKSKKKKLIANN
jgi:hypothetical protein